ncbi:MAG: hypothetical protein E5X53_26305 [Mesorhizobium sp.]|uniref:hypothetical protein n=1 Tax=Mesorhizobium sp. TaxID=1871066 RepID=UPI001201E61A|nr:hypothetical protein [Mesorhizobium sp.]TIP70578.1 MAG: hypothetical protein E5X55_26555 [Mesorhizobium sp.]TIQ06768.1 MAG: hypothetical protein E5X57_24265 [Mesorhizobium sp.]TIR49012.1 MAG: hypothetical protein E5X53_26305 [Mesorhizobium sp.]TJV94847.1 MAG: hypothetical protein E5X52_26830 [Mesorhizobium sp.]
MDEKLWALVNYVSVAVSLASLAILIALVGLFGELEAGTALTKLVAMVFPWALIGGLLGTSAVVASAPGLKWIPLRHRVAAILCSLGGVIALGYVAVTMTIFVIQLSNQAS